MAEAEKKSRILTLEIPEVESLNVDGLDVEELERRIELASAVPTELAWTCSSDCGDDCACCLCETYCPTHCVDCVDCMDCGAHCASLSCAIAAPDEPIPA